MLFTLLLWLTLGVFIGLGIFFTGGFLTLALDRPGLQYRVAAYYSTLAHKLLGRSVLVERGTEFDIFSATHEAGKNADRFSLDGDTVHVTNDTGLLSHVYKKPFGLVAPPEDDAASYVSPEIAEFGEIEVQRREQNALVDEDGQYVSDLELPGTRPTVTLREFVAAMLPGSRSLADLSETEEIYKQSQAGFRDSKSVQLMIILIAFGVGSGLAWLVLTNAGGAAPTNVGVPSLGLLYPGVGL